MISESNFPFCSFTIEGGPIPRAAFLHCKGVKLMLLYEYAALKADEKKEKILQLKKKEHKCNSCVWGSWTGNKFKCTFSHCVKEDGFKSS
jgi:hypothetical protein